MRTPTLCCSLRPARGLGQRWQSEQERQPHPLVEELAMLRAQQVTGRATPWRSYFMFLSPLGERLGEGVMQETVFGNPLT